MSAAISIVYHKLQVTVLCWLPPVCMLLCTTSCFCGVCWHHKWVGLEELFMIGTELCGAWASPSAQYSCQSFCSAYTSMLHKRKLHILKGTIPRRVFCQGILRVSVSPGFVSCDISAGEGWSNVLVRDVLQVFSLVIEKASHVLPSSLQAESL